MMSGVIGFVVFGPVGPGVVSLEVGSLIVLQATRNTNRVPVRAATARAFMRSSLSNET